MGLGIRHHADAHLDCPDRCNRSLQGRPVRGGDDSPPLTARGSVLTEFDLQKAVDESRRRPSANRHLLWVHPTNSTGTSDEDAGSAGEIIFGKTPPATSSRHRGEVEILVDPALVVTGPIHPAGRRPSPPARAVVRSLAGRPGSALGHGRSAAPTRLPDHPPQRLMAITMPNRPEIPADAESRRRPGPQDRNTDPGREQLIYGTSAAVRAPFRPRIPTPKGALKLTRWHHRVITQSGLSSLSLPRRPDERTQRRRTIARVDFAFPCFPLMHPALPLSQG
jgi:hypothetical protein